MLSRVAARLVTGPVAFFLAGVLDVGLLLVAYLKWRVHGGNRRNAPIPPS